MIVWGEVIPFIVASVLAGVVLAVVCRLCRASWRRAKVAGVALAVLGSAYMLFFFRDPPRTAPADPAVIVAGADGTVANVAVLNQEQFRKVADFCGLGGGRKTRFDGGDVVRISIFLSLFDVHVNRAPIGGKSEFLGYFPGKHFFTFEEKSSDYNQHNSVLIENEDTCCLFNQIVGPVARRVVYWPDHNAKVPVQKGDPIGMMKFGSRLDLCFPKADVEVTVKIGDKVRAGETCIARLARKNAQ
jgi:phosphatidylserine decarboxylase